MSQEHFIEGSKSARRERRHGCVPALGTCRCLAFQLRSHGIRARKAGAETRWGCVYRIQFGGASGTLLEFRVCPAPIHRLGSRQSGGGLASIAKPPGSPAAVPLEMQAVALPALQSHPGALRLCV